MLFFKKILSKRDIFIPYFSFSKVNRGNIDDLLLKEIYKLRYEVYCEEYNFLNPRDYAQGMESDEYDDCSTHFAAHTREQNIIGTVRLVQPNEGQMYPWEAHCQQYSEFIQPKRESAAEISRLVVHKQHRRRRGDSMQGISKSFMEKGNISTVKPKFTGRDKRGNSPLLLLGLYREMYRHSRANNVRYWYAAMERALAHSLDKMGFRFVPIGPQVDYYGPVRPYMVDLDELNENLRQKNKFLYAWFNDKPIPKWILFKAVVSNLWGRVKKR